MTAANRSLAAIAAEPYLPTESELSQWGPPPEAPPSSWAPVPLGPILAGEVSDDAPSLLRVSTGDHLLYAARIHGVHGEPEALKGWASLVATAQVLSEGGRVVLIDFEDSAASIVGRLRALSVDDAALVERFEYVRPDEPATTAAAARDLRDRVAGHPALVIVDGVTEAMTIHGLDLNSNADIATFLTTVARPFADCGAAVLLIDHVVKSAENRGRYALGGQHKLAGIDVAFSARVTKPFGRGKTGVAVWTVVKDRPGHIRQGAADDGACARFTFRSDPERGEVTASIDRPGPADGFRPTVLMEKVSRVLESGGGDWTVTAIRKAVEANDATIDLARATLIAEGYIEVRKDGRAQRHRIVKPFRQVPDEA